MLKRVLTFFAAAVVCFNLLMCECAAGDVSSPAVFEPDFDVASEAAYMINMDTQSVMYAKNGDKRYAPSALAQIMTALIVFENVKDINAQVTANVNLYTEFDAYRAKYEGIVITAADVLPGETLTVKDLLAGLLLQSGCECANILADYVGQGSISKFVDMMNARAAALGCTDTNFTNPHGLYDENQYTTARDMALISKRAMEITALAELCTKYSYKVPATNKHSGGFTLYHSNAMMNSSSSYYYSYAQGIKTAASQQSGRSIVTTARKSGNRYLLVLMNAPLSDAEGNYTYGNLTDARNVLNWALTKFEYRMLLSADEEVDGLYVLYAEGDGYVNLKPANSYSALWLSTLNVRSSLTKKTALNYDRYENGVYYVHAPVKKGDVLGSLTLMLGSSELYTVDLVAAADVKKSLLKERVALAKLYPQSFQFKLALVMSLVFFIVYTVLIIYFKQKQSVGKLTVKKSSQTTASKNISPEKRMNSSAEGGKPRKPKD